MKKEWIIFLVDDDPDDRDLFAEAMRETEYIVHFKNFASGTSLLKELENLAALPDMIFLDLYMPKMDGEACLRAVRKVRRFKSIPIIIYSTIFDLERIAHLFELGANRYLRKPSTFSALKTALQRTIMSISQNPVGGHAVINYS